MIRANQSAFVSGMSECGKSRLLWDLYVEPHPRRLSYDPVGDTRERNPRAVSIRTADEFAWHLKRATASGRHSWHFVLWGEQEEAVKALELLAPSEAAPDSVTLCRALGGVIFESGEIDTLAANNASESVIRMRSKWQRGRHHLLSFAVASQAPALVSRIVTANSRDIYAFAHSEQTSIRWFAGQMGDAAAERISRLKRFCYVHFNKPTMTCSEYETSEKRGAIVRRKVRDIPVTMGAAMTNSDD